MGLKAQVCRVQRWHVGDHPDAAHGAIYWCNPDHPTHARSTLGDGEHPHHVRAKIESGKDDPVLADIETHTALLVAAADRHDELTSSMTAVERRTAGMQALHDEMAAKLAEGTGATLAEVHAAAHAHAETLAIAHQSERVQMHVESLKDRLHKEVADQVLATKAKHVDDLHAAIEVEMADMRATHADLSATIGAAIVALPDAVQRIVLARHPEMQPHIDAHVASVLGDDVIEATPAEVVKR